MQALTQNDTVHAAEIAGGIVVVAQPNWNTEDWERTVYGLGLADIEVNDQDMTLTSSGHLLWWVVR